MSEWKKISLGLITVFAEIDPVGSGFASKAFDLANKKGLQGIRLKNLSFEKSCIGTLVNCEVQEKDLNKIFSNTLDKD